MRPKPLLVPLLVAASAALLVLAAQFRHQASAARVSLAGLARNRAALEPRLAQAGDRADRSLRAQARLRARLGRLQADPQPSVIRKTPATPPSLPAQLVADPKLFALYRQAFRAHLAVVAAGQYRALGLTRDQIDRFEALATEHQAEIQELWATAEAQGLTISDPDIAAVRQQENASYRAAVTAATGLSEAQILQIQQGDFPGPLQPLQGAIQWIETHAATAEMAPLTYEQQQELTLIAARTCPSYLSGGPVDPKAVNWNAVVAQAAGALSPPQINAIRTAAQLNQLTAMVHEFNAHP